VTAVNVIIARHTQNEQFYAPDAIEHTIEAIEEEAASRLS
jgi:hypothetical protein